MSYTLTLTDEERNALAWVADRYTSAEVLYAGMEETDAEGTFTVPEHVAWEYAEALPLDNGNPAQSVPPCVGGMLADKLLTLLDSIV